jgi:hypothetical protein
MVLISSLHGLFVVINGNPLASDQQNHNENDEQQATCAASDPDVAGQNW